MHRSAARAPLASYLAFAAFGLFWGTWGTGLPALRDAAGTDAAGLGLALLCVGAGALPAMLLTGRAVDRFGARIGGALLAALALAGVLTAALARDLPTLALGMLLVGATSGAADVAANALAGMAEQRAGGRVITIAHAVFSSFVVVGSLGAGVLRDAGAEVLLVFAVGGALMVPAAVGALVLGERAPGRRQEAGSREPAGSRAARFGSRRALPLVVVGLVGALAFASENAHQSWSAIFLADELAASPGLTAIAPATFAACAAVTRFAAGFLTRIPSQVLLVGGGLVAVAGTLLVVVAQQVPVALVGLGVAAVGTSVLYPTLLSRATRDVPAQLRGRATSAVATTSYLGFLLGPVYVGLITRVADLRAAMAAVALLVAAFVVLAPTATRRRADPQRSGPPVLRPTGEGEPLR